MPESLLQSDRGGPSSPEVASDVEDGESSLFVDQNDEIKSENESNFGLQNEDRDRQRRLSKGGQLFSEEVHISELYDDSSDDSDSDRCIIVDRNDIPDDVKAKFARFEFGGYPDAAGDVVCLGSVRVKADEEDDIFGVLRDADNEPDADADADPDFEMDEHDGLSDGEGPRKRRRRALKRQAKPSRTFLPAHGPPQQPQEEWTMPSIEELGELYSEAEDLKALAAQGVMGLPQRVRLAKLVAKIATIEKVAAQQPLGAGSSSEVPGDDQLSHEGEGESKARRRPPKTAKENWEREYAEKGSGIRNVTEPSNKRKRASAKNNGKNNNPKESRLMHMLKDSNPIMARAAQGAIPMPGPIQATRQQDQLKAMKEFLFNITGNTKSHSKLEDQRRLKEAIKSFGYRKVRVRNGKWELRTGMLSTLYNHQLVGVSWMLRQEFSPNGPYGGILGDQMGLGKTVQLLSAMSANRPSAEDIAEGRHQTLIVAPAVAIEQWKRVINKHCDKSFIKAVHHYRASQKVPEEVWGSANVM